MQLKTFFVQDKFGNVQPGARVYVYQRGTQTLVTGLRDASGSALSNPVVADAQGAVSIVADDGIYSVRTVSAMQDITVDMQFVDMHAAAQAALDSAAEAAASAKIVTEHAVDIAAVAQVLPDVAAAANQMLLAAESSGPVFANTHAEMMATSYPDGAVIEVLQDETQGGERTRYTRSQGQLLGPVLIMDYIRRALLASAAAGLGSALIGHASEAGATTVFDALRQLDRASVGRLTPAMVGLLSVEKGGTNSAQNAIKLEALRQAAIAIKGSVYVPAGTYLLPPEINLSADNTEWIFAPGATLKLHDAQSSRKNFIVFNGAKNQRVAGLTIDANRAVQDTGSFGVDHCACIVIDGDGLNFYNATIISSPAKGFAVVSTPGGISKNITVDLFYGKNCGAQALIVDGNNITGQFENIKISNVKIGGTGHAGISINDGAHDVIVSNVIADVQNSVWDAVSIRDSHDIKMSNIRCSRGRNGLGISRLNGYCGRIQLDNISCDDNAQNGILLTGAEDIAAGALVGRNNAAAGINITKNSAGYACKNIAIAAPSGYDDRTSSLQQYGIIVSGVNGLKLGRHIAYGNTLKNIYILRESTSDVQADIVQRASVSTFVASSSQQVVTVNWPLPFDDAEIDVTASIQVASHVRALNVVHIVAVTAEAVQVMVVNLSSTQRTGTLTVTGTRRV